MCARVCRGGRFCDFRRKERSATCVHAFVYARARMCNCVIGVIYSRKLHLHAHTLHLCTFTQDRGHISNQPHVPTSFYLPPSPSLSLSLSLSSYLSLPLSPSVFYTHSPKTMATLATSPMSQGLR